MYQVDSSKRYNITVKQTGHYLNDTVNEKNVQLLLLDRGIVVYKDDNGKEHICTGSVGIYLEEVWWAVKRRRGLSLVFFLFFVRVLKFGKHLQHTYDSSHKCNHLCQNFNKPFQLVFLHLSFPPKFWNVDILYHLFCIMSNKKDPIRLNKDFFIILY